MPQEILTRVAEDIKDVDVRLVQARELIMAMKEAGEDVTPMETDIRQLETRRNKWERMLKARGII